MDRSHSQGLWPLRIITAPRNTIDSHEYLDKLKHRLKGHVARHLTHSAKCVACVVTICGVAPSAVGMKLEGLGPAAGRLASEVRSESSRNPFDPIVERSSPSEPSTNAHLPADDDSTEPIEHTFGTYKHPDFGAASEAYALKRQLTDTLSEYTAHATVPSPRIGTI